MPGPDFAAFPVLFFVVLALIVAGMAVAIIVAIVRGGRGTGTPNSRNSAGNRALIDGMEAARLHSQQHERDVQLNNQLIQQQIVQQQINNQPPPSA